jgi:hypothetical protein
MLREDRELVEQMIKDEIAKAFKAIQVVKAETPKPVEVEAKIENPSKKGKKEE